MHYKTATAWIFAVLVLSVVLMILYPTGLVIGLGMFLVPVLLLVQTVVVLRSSERSEKTFSEGHWYEDREKQS
jgi:branched-subunit amino acid permease